MMFFVRQAIIHNIRNARTLSNPSNLVESFRNDIVSRNPSLIQTNTTRASLYTPSQVTPSTSYSTSPSTASTTEEEILTTHPINLDNVRYLSIVSTNEIEDNMDIENKSTSSKEIIASFSYKHLCNIMWSLITSCNKSIYVTFLYLGDTVIETEGLLRLVNGRDDTEVS